MVSMIRVFLLCLLAAGATAQDIVYYQFAPGGDLFGTWNSQTIAAGAVTLAKQANLAADSIQCNATSNPATAQACNPLAVVNMQSDKVTVNFVATGNITLSGTQTIDGVVAPNGSAVLAAGQTSSVNDGFYIVNTSGAWTLAINFPSGYVIAAGCNVAVEILGGVQYAGSTWILNTSSAVTIGTSAQTWTQEQNLSSYNAVALNTGIFDISIGDSVHSTNIAPFIASNFLFSIPNATTGGGSLMSFSTGNGFEGAGGAISFAAGNAVTQGSSSYAGANMTMLGGAGVGTGVGGNILLEPGAGGASGTPGFIEGFHPLASFGAAPTITGTGACATNSTKTGGSFGGTFVCTGTTGTATATVTFPTVAGHGYTCFWSDKTSGTPLGDAIGTTTTAVMNATLVTTNDVIGWGCFAYK
jgi:hypothetical protein